jgi:beta-N-acetylglucosaminidase
MQKENHSIHYEVVKAVLALNNLSNTINGIVESVSFLSAVVTSVELPESVAMHKDVLQDAGQTMAMAMEHYRMVVEALSHALLEMPEEKPDAEPPVVLSVRH